MRPPPRSSVVAAAVSLTSVTGPAALRAASAALTSGPAGSTYPVGPSAAEPPWCAAAWPVPTPVPGRGPRPEEPAQPHEQPRTGGGDSGGGRAEHGSTGGMRTHGST